MNIMQGALFRSAIILALFGFGCNLNIESVQAAKFDIMTYTAPQGYSAQDSNGTKVFTKKNKATGKFSLIFLYPSTGSFGNSNTDFDRRWKQLVGNQAKGAPEKKAASGDGYSGVLGHSLMNYEGGDAAAILMTITTKGKLITALAITNDENGARDFDAFLSKVDVDTDSIVSAATPRQTPTQQTSNNSVPSNGNSASITQQQLIGRWVTGAGYAANDGAGGINARSNQYNGGTYSRDITFRADGTVFNGGKKVSKFNKYCRDERCQNGRYSISGNIITTTYLDGNVEKHEFLGFDQTGDRLFMKLKDITDPTRDVSYGNYYRLK
jgi:Lipocalin-like domain